MPEKQQAKRDDDETGGDRAYYIGTRRSRLEHVAIMHLIRSKRLNAERPRPSARRRVPEEANAQRPTPNAQRSMKKVAISLQVLFCRSNADEENSDKFFSLAKDGRHSRPREHCGLLQEPQPAFAFFQLLKANPELVNKIFA